MKNKIKTPKSFKLLGQKYNVKYDTQLYHNAECVGRCDYEKNEIKLQPSTESIEFPSTQIEKTYLHEVVHLILKNSGSNELANNEDFVDTFAGCLHQILRTSKY